MLILLWLQSMGSGTYRAGKRTELLELELVLARLRSVSYISKPSLNIFLKLIKLSNQVRTNYCSGLFDL